MLQRVRNIFSKTEVSPLVNNADELTVLVNEVKVTFLRYPFPPDEPFVVYEHGPLLSVRDIAVTEAYTIGRRGSYNYVDLFFIIAERHATLTEITHGAERKYGTDFNSAFVPRTACLSGGLGRAEIQFLKPVTPKGASCIF